MPNLQFCITHSTVQKGPGDSRRVSGTLCPLDFEMSTKISSQVPAHSVENISIKRIEALDTPAYIREKKL